jgi:general stress protein 26
MKEADKNIGGEVKNLTHEEAIKKFKELVEHNAVCMFTSNLMTLPLTTRPMSVQQVDDEGSFWFLSADDSNKNQELGLDSRVQLFFQNVSDFEFLTVYGNAYILRDQEKIEELWNPIAKAWFSEGKKDPRITVIKIKPEEAFYWDTKSGKIVSMFKILASAVIGKTLSEGVEGTLSVN